MVRLWKRIRWRQVAIILTSFLVLVSIWYITALPATEVRADYGGTFIEGVAGAPRAINPLLSQLNDADRDLVALVFSGLTRLDERGAIIPDLAESWETSSDGLSYTFRLRPGVVWHDGVPFTAADVVLTIETIRNPEFPGVPELSSLWSSVSVVKVDDLTVKFSLRNLYAPFLSHTTLGIVPSHILSKTPIKGLKESTFNISPVGTGPFKFKEATAGRVTLDGNPSYYLGRPYLSTIEVKFYPDYPSALSGIERGEIHGLLSRQWLSPEDIKRISEDEKLVRYLSIRPSYSIVFLNLRFPLFKEKVVRQALLYGLDRETMVTDLLAGQGMVAQSPIVPGTWAYDGENTKRYEYDPEKAVALLESAGWLLNQDGVREKAGVQFRFHLLSNDDKSRIAVGEEMVRQWRRLGIRAELSSSGPTRLLRDFLIPRRYEAALYGLDVGYDPDPYPAWHSSQISENGFNFASFSNEKADQILEKARQSTSRIERAKLYGEFQAIFTEEVPSLLLYYPAYTYIADEWVKGINCGVLFERSSRFNNVKDWYMRTKEVEVGR
ncbi:MAG: ABC transporter substrate-binding protein [Chloroflexota bacterium]